MTLVSPQTAMPAQARGRRTIAVTVGAAGLLLVLVGAWLPWITLFRGLSVLRGFQLDGGPLAALALAVAVLALLADRWGSGLLLRAVATTGAAVVLVDAVLSAVRTAAYVAQPGPAAALVQPASGVGPYVTAAGGSLLLVAALLMPVRRRRLGRERWLRLALGATLYVAAAIHLLLTPEHLAEAPLLGLGFLLGGAVQLVLTVAVLRTNDGRVPAAVLMVSVALIVLYAYAVFIGLPFGDAHAEHATGLVVGGGEPVDLAGLLDLLAEVAAAVLAVVSLRRAGSRD